MITTHVSARALQRGVSRFSWLLLALGAGALIYWFAPHGNPVAPTELSPSDARLIGDLPTFTHEIQWRQGGFVRALRGPSPGRAYRFVICFYDVNVAQHDCATATNVIHAEEREAQTIPRDEILRGGWQDWLGSGLAPSYRYRYVVTLPQAALDKSLAWTIGACSERENSSCSFAEPAMLEFTARDLAAHGIDDDPHMMSDVKITVRVRNDGRTDGESYQLDTIVWELLLQPRSVNALTDVNHQLVMPNDIVITAEGQEHPVADYRTGVRPVSEVKGIHRPGTVRQTFSRTVPTVPRGLPAGQALAPGTNNGVYDDVPPCDAPPCLLAPPSTRPAVFGAFASVDPQQLLWEFEESDNHVFKDGIYVP